MCFPKLSKREPSVRTAVLATALRRCEPRRRRVYLERLQRFYGDFYGGANGELSLVGDFDPAAVKPLLAQLFGNWDAAAGQEHQRT